MFCAHFEEKFFFGQYVSINGNPKPTNFAKILSKHGWDAPSWTTFYGATAHLKYLTCNCMHETSQNEQSKICGWIFLGVNGIFVKLSNRVFCVLIVGTKNAGNAGVATVEGTTCHCGALDNVCCNLVLNVHKTPHPSRATWTHT